MAELKNDYNPYEYRDVPFPISNIGALTNIIKAMVGTGILVAPMAFRNAGWLNGLISTAIIGMVVLYSKEILMYGMYEIARRRRVPVFTYAEGVVEAIAEGPPCMRGLQGLMRWMVNTLLVVYHFGSCCVYVVFMANCLKDLGDKYWIVWDSRFYMLCTILPLCLIYCVRNLKSLVPFAMAANFSLIIGHILSLCPYYTKLTEVFGEEYTNKKNTTNHPPNESFQFEAAESNQSLSMMNYDEDSSSQYLSDNPIAITPEPQSQDPINTNKLEPKLDVKSFGEYQMVQPAVQAIKLEINSVEHLEQNGKKQMQDAAHDKNCSAEHTKELELKRIELQKIRIEFEREKFKMEMEMQQKRLKLEEEKLKVKQRWQDREFELKRLEIEANERLAMYEIDKKHNMK